MAAYEVPPGQRMTLTEPQYKQAKVIVAQRPTRLSELNIDCDDELPWDNPKIQREPEIGINIYPAGTDLSRDPPQEAQAAPTKKLLAFLSDPLATYARSGAERLFFPNYYVSYWLELEERVRLFEEGERPAKEMAKRAEKRASVAFVVSVLGLLISAITLALKFFGK